MRSQRDYGHTQNISDSTAAIIDEEVKKLIEKAYKECEEILTAHRDQLVRLSEYLIENEKIDGDDFEKLMRDELDWKYDPDAKKDAPAETPADDLSAPVTD